MSELTLSLPPEVEERIAQRAAEILAEHNGASGGEDGWLRGAKRIAEYIGCVKEDGTPRTGRVRELSSAGRIPVEKEGRGLVAKRSELDAWIRNGGGIRP